MHVLLYSITATLIISLISLSGILTFVVGKKYLKDLLFFMISFSTGSLMGGAFFHLLPEALAGGTEPLSVFKITLIGFIFFYVMERVLRWRHCHEDHCHTHQPIGYQNLFGDGLHNLIDGLIIVSAFSVDTKLGISVTLSVALHEIPQEISDFGVLIYSGFSKAKALFYNLLSALLAVVGAVIGFVLIEQVDSMVKILLPLAAGGFIYISASDLIPELHKESNMKKSLAAFVFFLAALGFMLLMRD